MTARSNSIVIPSVEERPELTLKQSALWTPGSIGAFAERAARVAHLVLGVEEELVEDVFTGQLEAMKLEQIPEDLVPVASVRIGAGNKSRRVWKPSHVVNGHDHLTLKNGQAVPETYVWKEIFAGRTAEWWNKRRAEELSSLTPTPLTVVLADAALRGTSKNWAEQRAELQELVDGHNSPYTTVEGMTPMDWVMMDADAIIGGTARPDEQTVTRFVQYDQDRSGARGAYGPCADVDVAKARLGGSNGYSDPYVGFRSVMGPKQAS